MEKKHHKHLSLEQRQNIYDLTQQGLSPHMISNKLGINVTTIYRELKRGKNPQTKIYDPQYSEDKYRVMLSNKGTDCFFEKHRDIAEKISSLILQQGLSPEAALDNLKGNIQITLPSKQTLYTAIYNNLIPGVTRETLYISATSVYSDGMIRIPKWVRDKLSIQDGDTLGIEVLEDGVKFSIQKKNKASSTLLK